MQNGLINKDLIKITVILEEKPIMDVFKHAVVGELPTSIAFFLKKRLLD
jgi:hypothetical protein